jgi:predicted RNase H-like HicB family nuclease
VRRTFHVVVERHANCYVAYPLGLNGGVVGEGATLEEAVADVESAIVDHLATFGGDALADEDEQPLDVHLHQLSVEVPARLRALISGTG